MSQYVQQDSTVLVVLDLLRRIDADLGVEFLYPAIGSFRFHFQCASIGKLRFEQIGQPGEVVHLFARETKRLDILPFFKLQRQDTHADEVGPVNALEALRDHSAYA